MDLMGMGLSRLGIATGLALTWLVALAQERVLDLTPNRNRAAFILDEMRVITPVNPSYIPPYQLPIVLSVQSIRAGTQQELVMEMSIRNTGTEALSLPMSLDPERKALRMENSRRRLLKFRLRLQMSDRLQEPVVYIGETDGSESDPSSLLQVKPQETVIVKITLPEEAAFWLNIGSLVSLQAICLEWTLEGGRNVIKSQSLEVRSEKFIPPKSQF